MAALTNQQRSEDVAEIQRTPDCPGAITKPQLRAAYNALDDWWEATGAAAANAAIPQPQRGLMTTRQKASLFFVLLRRKYEVS